MSTSQLIITDAELEDLMAVLPAPVAEEPKRKPRPSIRQTEDLTFLMQLSAADDVRDAFRSRKSR